MNTDTKTTGTCGACFREMTLDSKGFVIRHGWSEYGGQRSPGSYGNVRHTGPCFGTGRLPYEVSSGCTEAFLGHVLLSMGVRALEYIAWLGTNPALYHQGSTFVANADWVRGLHEHCLRRSDKDYWNGYLVWTVRVQHGDSAYYLKADSSESVWDSHRANVPSYESMHASALTTANTEWDCILRDSQYCWKMISEWKPMPVKTVAKKGVTVHFQSRTREHKVLCRNGYGLTRTTDPELVTCTRCRKYLDSKK